MPAADAPPPVVEGRSRRPGAWILLLLLTGLGVFWGGRALLPEAVPVVVLEQRDIRQTLVVSGQVRSPSIAQLGAAVAGVVTDVLAGEGDRVSAGQLVVRLDAREARAAVAQAEAALAEVSSRVREDVERAENELAQAERDLARTAAVVAEGGLTLQRLEQAEQRVADARSRAAGSRAAMGPAGTSATVVGARAALEAASARLSLARIVAPSDGIVLKRLVEPGDAVQPGKVLAEIAADGPIEVVAYPSEENLSRLAVGARARVSADAYPADTFHATATLIAPAVDPGQGTVELRLSVDEPPAYLRPAMTLSVNLELGRRNGAQVLPVEAVRGLGTQDPWVGVVRDGRIERRAVVLGLRGEAFVEVLSGLDPGEPVVLGREALEPGARVRLRD